MFLTEKEMVIALVSLLENNDTKLDHLKECIFKQEVDGLIGRPDLLLKNKNNKKIITIELKLKNWKRALAQAYKYKSFSDISYVCMDQKNISPALEHIEMFKKYNIGLITIDNKNIIKVYHKPKIKKAYSQQLYTEVQNLFEENSFA